MMYVPYRSILHVYKHTLDHMYIHDSNHTKLINEYLITMLGQR